MEVTHLEMFRASLEMREDTAPALFLNKVPFSGSFRVGGKRTDNTESGHTPPHVRSLQHHHLTLVRHLC